jgi:hypothetical protein
VRVYVVLRCQLYSHNCSSSKREKSSSPRTRTRRERTGYDLYIERKVQSRGTERQLKSSTVYDQRQKSTLYLESTRLTLKSILGPSTDDARAAASRGGGGRRTRRTLPYAGITCVQVLMYERDQNRVQSTVTNVRRLLRAAPHGARKASRHKCSHKVYSLGT